MKRLVRLSGDGAALGPADYLSALAALGRAGSLVPDQYALGGSVEQLEKAMARELGKERALYCPTGTLANLLALRALCAGRPRVLVQAESHLANDAGDGTSVLAGLELIPLGGKNVCFSENELSGEIERAASARVKSAIGAVAVESPVRRCFNRAVPLAQMKSISRLCRRAGIGLHLDGARLFVASAALGVPVRRFTGLFDTVYVSLYKHFGAPSGAILAGPGRLIKNLHHARRMFGGSPAESFLQAGLALRGLRKNLLPAALARGQRLVGLLPGILESLPDGTNIAVLNVSKAGAPRAAARLKAEGIMVKEYKSELGGIPVTFNETLLWRSEDSLVKAIRRAVS